MKKVALVLMVLTLSACGKESNTGYQCAPYMDPVTGNNIGIAGFWKDTNTNEIFSIRANCAFESNQTTQCNQLGFISPTFSTGKTTVGITSNSGFGSCIPVGTQVCDVTIDNYLTQMTLVCGGVTYNFERP